MPTVLRIDGYEIVIYLNDHLPHHVHVFAHGCEAIVELSCPDGIARVRKNRNFKSRELKKVVRMVQAHQAELCANWEKVRNDME
jgi:Domain of unknown function (DUF4160)